MSAKFLLTGDCSLSVQMGDTISLEVNRQVRMLFLSLTRQPVEGIKEMVPTYASLMVHYRPEVIRFARLKEEIEKRLEHMDAVEEESSIVKEIPICYGGELGPDLEDCAAFEKIVPLVLVSLSLAMCSISNSTKLGRIAGRSLAGFFGFYVCGAFLACVVAYLIKSMGLFNVTLPSEAVTEAQTIDAFNPLAVIVNAVPSNITEAFRTNNSILAVVVVAIGIGLCLNQLGEKTAPLKAVLESANEVIQLYLTFLINKVGPIAIFCLISRTFAIYGVEYLAPAAAYVVSAMLTLFLLTVTIYPVGIYLTTGLNPVKFLKKIAKVGVFGFSTNSSAACLPLNTRACIDELGCSEEITSFVLPTGMTINMNGTTVMHMFAVTFIATSAGINVRPSDMIVMAFLSICASAGTPAIPIAGTTMIFTVLSGMGWTTEACLIGYALIVAINRPVEMALLPLNVIGDAATNIIVNAKEKEIDLVRYNQ